MWVRGALVASMVWAAFSCGGGEVGCAGTYNYPRADPAAAPTPKVMRLRLTQEGIDTISGSLPALIAATCSEPAPDASCSVDDPANPALAWFFLGTPGEPMTFNGGQIRTGGLLPFDEEFEGGDVCFLSDSDIEERPYCDDTGGARCLEVLARGLGATGNGFCRLPTHPSCTNPATDYCCGLAAPALCSGAYTLASCDAYRSRAAINLGDLRGHISVRLIDGGAAGDRIEMVLGCTAADPADCNDAGQAPSWIKGSLDMVVQIEVGGDGACNVHDEAGAGKAFEIRTLRFSLLPDVVLGLDGKPYLRVDEASVVVDSFEFQLYTDVSEQWDDPGCYDEGWSTLSCNSDWDEDCTGPLANYCAAGSFASTLASLFEGLIGDTLAQQIAQAALGAFAEEPLEAVGALDVAALLPLPTSANPVGYLLAANPDSPDITGGAGAPGLNLDFDAGFVGEHHACVPVVSAPDWSLPALPDPGALIDALDPVSGELRPETYHLAAVLGDALARRAAYALFDAGALCLDLEAQAIERLPGGAFSPTIGMLALVAPGLAALGPAESAVDLRLTPRYPLVVSFGTGQDTGNGVDSHIKIDWSQVGVSISPLVDDSFLRALGLEVDLHLGLSLNPTPEGNLRIMLDGIAIDNVVETYNEIGLVFSAQDFADLLETLLPTVLANSQFDVSLTAASLGFPLVPKVRAVGPVDAGNRYLGVFLRLCTPDQVADPADALCYEAPLLAVNAAGDDVVGAAVAAGPSEERPDAVRVRLFANQPAAAYELAYRVDRVGPFFSFHGADPDELFTLAHPFFRLNGLHVLELVARLKDAPGRWSDTVTKLVWSDHSRPVVRGARSGGRVVIAAWDDVTPPERLPVAAQIGAQEIGFAVRAEIDAPADRAVTLWVKDEAGNVSEPYTLPAQGVAPAPAAHAGCASLTPAWAAAGAWLVLLRRRRRRAY